MNAPTLNASAHLLASLGGLAFLEQVNRDAVYSGWPFFALMAQRAAKASLFAHFATATLMQVDWSAVKQAIDSYRLSLPAYDHAADN